MIDAAPNITRRNVWRLVSAVIVLGSASLAIAADVPQRNPNALRGKAIAERWCASCHLVAADSTTTIPEGVPTFRSIANRPGQTAENIRWILIKPHVPMPDMHLTRSEIEDVIAYIDALRDKESGPPLLPKSRKDEPGPATPSDS